MSQREDWVRDATYREQAMTTFNRILLAAAIPLVVAAAGCGPAGWENNFEAGLSRAASERRPALVMFSSAVSPDCAQMDEEVFPDPQVRSVLGSFVRVRIDYLIHNKLARELNVRSVPTFVVFRPDRSVAGVQEGKMDARSFSFFLIRYRYY